MRLSPSDKAYTETDESALKDLRRAALRMLARRDHSQHELVQKLQRKGYLLANIEIVLQNLLAKGWLNDERYTENYITMRRNKGLGPRRIEQELYARCITAEMIAEHLKITDNVWLSDAERAWRKQFKSKLPKTTQEYAKQVRFLQYRGFTQEHIKQLLKNTYDNEE